MSTSSLIISIVVIVVIILMSICSYRFGHKRLDQCGEFINGFWRADYGWCRQAGLSNVYCNINFYPDQKHGVMYILMQNLEDQAVNNDSYSFKTSVSISELVCNDQGTTECNLMFLDDKSPCDGLFPMECKLRIDIRHGILVLHDGNTVFLELYKDNMTSSRVERMSHEQYIETYLPKQERTDPQIEDKETYLPNHQRSDLQGETILPPVDESEGQLI